MQDFASNTIGISTDKELEKDVNPETEVIKFMTSCAAYT